VSISQARSAREAIAAQAGPEGWGAAGRQARELADTLADPQVEALWEVLLALEDHIQRDILTHG